MSTLADRELHHEVKQFLFREAALLDGRQWSEWLAMFEPDGMYWVPLRPEQTDPLNEVSLFWENAMMREVRARRLEHERNWSQQPQTSAIRVVANVRIDAPDASGPVRVRSVLQVVESQNGVQRLIAGSATHTLARAADGTFRIRLKRVDLIDAGRAFENLQVFL